MRPKIFLLYPYYYPHFRAGGPVQSLYNLVDSFKNNCDFYFVSLSNDIDGSPANPAVQFDHWRKGPQGENIYYTESISFFLIVRLIKEVKPNLIFVNGLFNTSTTIPGIVLAKWWKIRLVISPRGMLQAWGLQKSRLKKRIFLIILKLIIGKNEAWHATDDHEKTDIIKYFGPEQVVHIASNIPRQVSNQTQLPFPFEDDKIRLVFLSLINPNKNLHLVIDALKQFREKFTLDIYGPIANQSYWKLCKVKMEGEKMIFYHGAVPPWNISDVLKNYHFFILPTQGENFGHAIFDALSSSVPVVISRNTPWKGIDDYGAGFFIDLSIPSLELILQQILNMSANEYQNFRINAQKYANEFWNSIDYVKEYQFLLKGDRK